MKKVLEDEKKQIPNKIITVQVNSSIKIKGKNREYYVEFINMTHSIPHTAMIALHTKEGIVVYGNDFKIDNTPVLGDKPNYKALNRISKQGVKVAIIDSLYCGSETKTPSEKIARNMIEEVLLTVRNEKAAIFVTTFSSHIARLKSIVEFGKKLDRKIFFIGRSLERYMSAASRINLVQFRKDVELKTYKNQVSSALRQVSKNREKYMVVCTGNQGEPGSILTRISSGQLPYKIEKGDNIIFSSRTIPTAITIANREKLEKSLKTKGARIFTDVHASGHLSREDIRDLIEMVNPKHIIPIQGDLATLTPVAELGKEIGYEVGKNMHMMQNCETLEVSK
ncbi:MAG: ribonuclease J [Nitrospinae bacterium]|nr:ribonuclease J [Nitrospinota bacterium]